MAIDLLSGKGVGSGKSYYVMCRVWDLIRFGGTVYYSDTFEPVFWPREATRYTEAKAGLRAMMMEVEGLEPLESQLVAVPRDEVWRLHEVTPEGTEENPILIIVDEAQRTFNARDFADKTKRAFFEWCCESRHDSNDLIFISQHEQNMDKQLRRLATHSIRVKNMEKWAVGGIHNFPIVRNYFCAVKYDGDSNTFLSSRWCRKRREIFQSYVSKSMRATHKRLALENPIKKHTLRRVKRNPMLRVYLVIFVLVVVAVVYQLFHLKAPSQLIPAAAMSTQRGGVERVEAVSPPKGQPVTNFMKIVPERFLAGDSQTYLVTDHGEYYLNEICPVGLVVRVYERSAQIVAPDGTRFFVVGVDGFSDGPEDGGPSRYPDAAPRPVAANLLQPLSPARGGTPPYVPSAMPTPPLVPAQAQPTPLVYPGGAMRGASTVVPTRQRMTGGNTLAR